MNDRFRKTLVLALRPDTGENEAAAAFSALRRMASSGNVSTFLDEKPETKVVYKDKTVHMAESYTHKFTYTVNIKATYLQDYIHTVFTNAVENGMCIHIIHLKGSSDNKITSPSELKFKVLGYEKGIKRFSDFLDRVEQEMLQKSQNNSKASDYSDKVKKPGFMKQLFRAIFN
jgi:hypothetical protein